MADASVYITFTTTVWEECCWFVFVVATAFLCAAYSSHFCMDKGLTEQHWSIRATTTAMFGIEDGQMAN